MSVYSSSSARTVPLVLGGTVLVHYVALHATVVQVLNGSWESKILGTIAITIALGRAILLR